MFSEPIKREAVIALRDYLLNCRVPQYELPADSHLEEALRRAIAAQVTEIPEGCGELLAEGQWWAFCGETDMGQTRPALCAECGGDYIRAS